MKQVISTERIPIKLWLDDIEEKALEQAKNVANLPFSFHHVAIMPDAHSGYGISIGGVFATKEVIVPHAVGSDIGCGVCARKTSLKYDEVNSDNLKLIMSGIRTRVPIGLNGKHKEQKYNVHMPINHSSLKVVITEYMNALNSLNSLGSGNHFIEIQRDIEGFIWIMIHSGSRNLGYKVADYYNKKAIELNQKYYSAVDKSIELAFFPLDSFEAQEYIKEMNYCLEYAAYNRVLMMESCFESLLEIYPSTTYSEDINVHHNYARTEHHFGKNVLVHRKGATSAKLDELGLVPGSQGTKSYVVIGLGNPDSFMSCSHGAGRKMGRKEAIKRLNLEEEIEKLNSQGIIHGIRIQKDLDEAAGSYKDISVVMENQSDLVKIVTELSPLCSIKG